MMLPVQKGYAKLHEYYDGTYGVERWLDMHIAISHADCYLQPPRLF